MSEVELKSLSVFVGTGNCNANCNHCAGKPLRKYAPKEDGFIDENLILKTLKDGYSQGARSLSISSSGEPTLSPKSITKTLSLVNNLKDNGMTYDWVNLYSNGIRIGEDKKISENYLPLWQSLGLKTVYITVHDINIENNAKIYGIENYPNLENVVSRIHDANLLTRANFVLSKNNIETCEKFVYMIEAMREIGFDHVSAWPIRNDEDQVDLELSPSANELDKMANWVDENQDPNCRIRLLRERDKIAYETGQKLTLFPDGTLSNTWCN